MSYSPIEKLVDHAAERELRRVGDALRTLQLTVFNVPPRKPGDGLIVICDGVNWNPIGDGLKRPVWFDVDAGVWKIFA